MNPTMMIIARVKLQMAKALLEGGEVKFAKEKIEEALAALVEEN